MSFYEFQSSQIGDEAMPQMPVPEMGFCTDLVFEGDLVIKTDKIVRPHTQAEQIHDNLIRYADALASEPIQVAAFRGAKILESGGGYRVQYITDVVRGPSVASLPMAERRQIASTMIGDICSMSVTDDPDELKVGIDSKVANWHVSETGRPVLVDLYPPSVRNARGRLTDGLRESTPSMQRYKGTKSGAITKILYSSLCLGFPEPNASQRLRHMLGKRDDWCYDLLPSDMAPAVRSSVRAEVRTHFAPIIASTAMRKISERCNPIRRHR